MTRAEATVALLADLYAQVAALTAERDELAAQLAAASAPPSSPAA